jgi:hypothetical protein
LAGGLGTHVGGFLVRKSESKDFRLNFSGNFLEKNIGKFFFLAPRAFPKNESTDSKKNGNSGREVPHPAQPAIAEALDRLGC